MIFIGDCGAVLLSKSGSHHLIDSVLSVLSGNFVSIAFGCELEYDSRFAGGVVE